MPKKVSEREVSAAAEEIADEIYTCPLAVVDDLNYIGAAKVIRIAAARVRAGSGKR